MSHGLWFIGISNDTGWIAAGSAPSSPARIVRLGR
jgi:hypothetical protein